MTQCEQVIDVMRKNGGYATLGQLYQKVDVTSWKTKTPFASIRRIVQNENYFFKIKPGLWALKELKEKVLLDLNILDKNKEEEFNHYYYQGLIVEIGNFKEYITYIPSQDKNKKFLGKPLSSIAKVTNIYDFTYKHILNRAKTIDVIWFNERKFPHSFFEVDHTSDIKNSLGKFCDLQDFYSNFYIVSNKVREKEFNKIMGYTIFKDIQTRVRFLHYDYILNLHSKLSELAAVRGDRL